MNGAPKMGGPPAMERWPTKLHQMSREFLTPNFTSCFASEDGATPSNESEPGKDLASWRNLVSVGLARELNEGEQNERAKEDKARYYACFEENDRFGRVRDLLIGLTAELIKQPRIVTVSDKTISKNKKN